MAKLTILEFPDPRLRTRAAPVQTVDDSIRRLIDDMFETMYEAPGIGLAATQVDAHVRVLVVDISPDRSEPLALVNPEIVSREGSVEAEEGCLSVPGIYDRLSTRSAQVTVRALDRDGQPFEVEADGLLAVCILHEMDHLEG
jgi:peptide deformylase